ncbi:hypothetical protein [Aquimarina sp. 2304DJ70-9]|uniref:hypothetical protein n=1 Tax=Aquimarina penaris TaxID=3231044 RepID=UPI0034628566
MTMVTFETYINAIRQKYLNDRGGELSTFLAKPTPGQLKDACIDVLGEIKNRSDQNILERFFELNDADHIKTIRKFDNDKLKPIANFLKNKTDSIQSPIALELVALLIDFQPRPFAKFQKLSNTQIDITKEQGSKRDITLISDETGNDIKTKADGDGNHGGKTLRNIIITISSISAIIVIALFALKMLQKDCMKWNGEYYELAFCSKSFDKKIIPIDEKLLNEFKKIKVDTNYTFFDDDGKAKVWYAKREGKIEFFNSQGTHPTNGNKLKPITQTIVRKYIFGE